MMGFISLDYKSATEALEEQKMLLQSLAMKENAATDFGDRDVKHSVYADLERIKKDTCIMLQDIWNRSRKGPAYMLLVFHL
jgi:hypothetical protein